MATQSTTADSPKPQAVDLRRLRQTDAAWLTGKPTSWFRNHSHRFDRDNDGFYDARDVVRVLAEMQAKPEPAELEDAHLEVMLTWLYDVTNHEGSLTGCVRTIKEIVASHGPSGLAAVGQIVQDIAENHLNHTPESIATEEEIRSEHDSETERRIARIARAQAERDMRTVPICEDCGKYRWGRQWIEQPLPAGYISGDGDWCPECEKNL